MKQSRLPSCRETAAIGATGLCYFTRGSVVMAVVAMPVAEAETVTPMAVAVEMPTPAPAAEMAVSVPPEAVESMCFLDMAGLRVDGDTADAWKCSGLTCGRRHGERTDSEQRGTND